MSSRDLSAFTDTTDCAAEPRSSKRYKTNLTGRGAFDAVFTTAATADPTPTVYNNIGKVTNQTGARITGFKVVVGTGTGANFTPASQSDLPVGITEEGTLQTRANVPCGLFGYGCAQTADEPSPEEGYFDTDQDNDQLTVSVDGDTVTFANMTEALGPDYLRIVGDSILDRSQVPTGLFIEDTDTASEDDLLVWKAPGSDTWLDENGDTLTQAEVDQRIADAKAAMGDAYVGTYEGDVEDMSNINMNFPIDVGVLDGQFTMRFIPLFNPIVEAAGSDYQFAVASSLDSSEIVFMNADPEFANVIAEINGLGTVAEKQTALERAGTSYLRNFGTQSFLMGRDQIEMVLKHLNNGRMVMPAGTTSGNMNASATSVEDISAVRLASSDSSAQGLAGLMAGTGGSNSMEITERFSVFFSGSVSTGDIDNTTNGAGADYNGYALTGGGDYRVTDKTRVGAAIGYGENEGSVNDNRGDLDVDGTTAMIYGSYGSATGLFADAVFGYSWLDYDNDRRIAFGTYNELAESSTDGKQKSFTLDGGYNFEIGRFIAGPSARFQYLDLEVDGYEENGAGVLSMSVEDMDFESRTIWLGGQVAMPIALDNGGFIQPNARLHWVKELEDEGTTVGTNFTGGTLPFSTPIDGRDDNYVRAGVGLDAGFTGWGQPMTVSVNYDGTLANDDYDEHRGSVSITMHF
ncbi:choice-of-anchor F family protein [Guyparkeria sp. SCN-R1]|uniref:choice-of-anchor F family protein n=1 Tax=Guyparkeria sp. SCN-R1 TaxID=2341113 RepID=UPI001315AD89|nr:choice-of-anchor F family protein [Guyparkeria sp. SCN-R1]